MEPKARGTDYERGVVDVATTRAPEELLASLKRVFEYIDAH